MLCFPILAVWVRLFSATYELTIFVINHAQLFMSLVAALHMVPTAWKDSFTMGWPPKRYLGSILAISSMWSVCHLPACIRYCRIEFSADTRQWNIRENTFGDGAPGELSFARQSSHTGFTGASGTLGRPNIRFRFSSLPVFPSSTLMYMWIFECVAVFYALLCSIRIWPVRCSCSIYYANSSMSVYHCLRKIYVQRMIQLVRNYLPIQVARQQVTKGTER